MLDTELISHRVKKLRFDNTATCKKGTQGQKALNASQAKKLTKLSHAHYAGKNSK